MPLRPRRFHVLLLFPLLACGGDDEGTGPDPDPAPVPGAPVAAALDISPAAATLTAIGDTLRLEAEVRDEDGQVMADATVAWSGLDDGVARVSSTGRVEAVAAGEARIVASSGPAADTAVVEVVQVPAGFEVLPARVRVTKGDTVRLTAAVVDANGFAVEDAADPVVWSSLDESVATVDASGLVTATTQGGETRVVATAGEWKAVARLRALDRIAFVSNRDGNAEIYVIFADGGGEANLTRDEASDAQPRWSPDGKRIAFLSDRDGNNEIYVMNADGGAVANLTNHVGIDQSPAWSPDGRSIAFQSQRDGNSEVYVMAADGSGQTNLTNHETSDPGFDWSPDATTIAFYGYRAGDAEVFVVGADGSGLAQLTTFGGHDPGWSPDGLKIAFVTDRFTFDDEIYVMNPNGSGQINLTNDTTTNDVHPVWSPDGSRIAFLKRDDLVDEADIYVMNADGTGVMNVTNDRGWYSAPTWSPDGTRIAFQRYRDDDWDIYVINADGTGLVRLTDAPGNDTEPAWMPVPGAP